MSKLRCCPLCQGSGKIYDGIHPKLGKIYIEQVTDEYLKKFVIKEDKERK